MRNIVDASKLDLKETIVSIRRVAKTVKGGRNMRFSVTVVVGNGDGVVGCGLGKAQEIPEAVRKATEDAKKNLIEVPRVGTTIPRSESAVIWKRFRTVCACALCRSRASPGNSRFSGSMLDRVTRSFR